MTNLSRFIGATIAALLVFLFVRYSVEQVQQRALVSMQNSSFVTFVGEFSDLTPNKYRDVFGWGAGEVISTSVKELAPFLHVCRQFTVEENEIYRYEVKVSVGLKRFRVVGILEGSERNPKLAACLRDKINGTTLERLATLTPASEDAYRLKMEVHPNVAAEIR